MKTKQTFDGIARKSGPVAGDIEMAPFSGDRMGWETELDNVRSNARGAPLPAQGGLTGMLATSRRKTNRDAASLRGDGIPTQLGLGEASGRTGLAAIQEELGRMAGALRTWLDHALAERSG